MRINRLSSLLILPLLLASIGCEGSGSGITLINKGAAPLQKLRYKFKPGSEQEMRMVFKMDMTTEVGGKEMPTTESPPILIKMGFTPVKVSPEGNLFYIFSVTSCEIEEDSEADPRMVAEMEKAFDSMGTISGSAEITATGKSQKFNLKMGKPNAQSQALLDNMRQQLEFLTVPLPDEPIGIGAKWRVNTEFKSKMLNLQQSCTFTLKEKKESSITLDYILSQKAEPQEITVPNLPPGTSTKLESMKGTGTGITKLELTNLVPISNKLTFIMNMVAKLSIQEREQKMKSNSTIQLTMERP